MGVNDPKANCEHSALEARALLAKLTARIDELEAIGTWSAAGSLGWIETKLDELVNNK